MFWFGCIVLGGGIGLAFGGLIGAALFFDNSRLSLARMLGFSATIVAGGIGGIYLMIQLFK